MHKLVFQDFLRLRRLLRELLLDAEANELTVAWEEVRQHPGDDTAKTYIRTYEGLWNLIAGYAEDEA